MKADKAMWARGPEMPFMQAPPASLPSSALTKLTALCGRVAPLIPSSLPLTDRGVAYVR